MNESRVCVITGASSGIGAALAEQAARAGYTIVAVGRNASALESVRAAIAERGGRILVLTADIREAASAQRIVHAALSNFGRIDVLVANAGVAGRGALATQSNAELAEQLETHVTAPLQLIREALPALQSSRGAVFILGSGVARIPIGGMGLYPPAKAALRSASRILRRELAPLGIGVSYVDPGVVNTAFMQRKAMPGAPAWLMVSPQMVAQAILRAFRRRPAEVNAAPWQTAGVALGERFPAITEFLLTRAQALTGVSTSAVTLPTASTPPQPPVAPPSTEADPLAAALAPFRTRMERSKLPLASLLTALQPGTAFNEDAFALAWAGMPNKHERALISEVCAALHTAGLLEANGERNWQVSPHVGKSEP